MVTLITVKMLMKFVAGILMTSLSPKTRWFVILPRMDRQLARRRGKWLELLGLLLSKWYLSRVPKTPVTPPNQSVGGNRPPHPSPDTSHTYAQTISSTYLYIA